MGLATDLGPPRRRGGAVSERVAELAARELAAGLETPAPYAGFGQRVVETKRKLLEFLIAAKAQGASIAGYGAPGKGNTLLNYCGIRTDFLDYTVDRNPYKHGRFTPAPTSPSTRRSGWPRPAPTTS